MKSEGRTRKAEGNLKLKLVCFAVKEEAGPFRSQANSLPGVETLITGMGARNAERAIRGAIAERRPTLVLTCGFAGGLKPGLEQGAVFFNADNGSGLETDLIAAGALAGKFHCAAKVATTVAEKRVLWESTGADLVEMESQVIRELCHKEKIPGATVRVLLDTAEQDLPLDFDQLMNEREEMDYGKLAIAIAKSPGKIGTLMRFQKQAKSAAEKLARVLVAALKA